MTQEFPDIAASYINLDHVEGVEQVPEAFEFEIVLNAKPYEEWAEEFETAYRNATFPIKPPVKLMDDRLRIVFLPRYEEHLQDFVELLEDTIQRAGEEVLRKHEGHTTQEQEERRDEFRDLLRSLRLRSKLDNP